MSYSLYLIKCVFTCSIFVYSNTKIFECFRCFWKVFCFYKNWKISKTMLPCFSDSVAGHPSCMLQPRARGLVLATYSLVKGPVARGTQRFSQLKSRLPREWDFQSRKTLSKFFQISRLQVFWRVTLATCVSREKRVFCISKTVFKKFSIFPSNFCDYLLSSPFLSQLKLTPTLLKLHFCIISSLIFKKKVWVFSVSLDFFMFWELFSFFWVVTVVWDILCSNMFLLRLLGICLSGVFMVCFPVVIYWSTLYCDNIRSLLTHEHSLSFSRHSHPVVRVFFIIHMLTLTHC